MSRDRLTKAQVKALEKPFHAMDKNGDGKLDPEELTEFFRSNSLDVTMVPALFKIFDGNNDGVLSFEEFAQCMLACQKTQKIPRHIFRLLFNALDKDRDGLLDLKDVIFFGECCSLPLTEAEIREELEVKNPKEGATFEHLCRMFQI